MHEKTFQLTELSTTATFIVSATRPLGGGAHVSNVKTGQSVEIALPMPGRISGAVVSAARDPVGSFQLTVSNANAGQMLTQVFTDPTGRFALEDVAPGVVEISAASLSGAAQAAQTVMLSPGQAANDLVIELAGNAPAAP